jgi:hypothetical protein
MTTTALTGALPNFDPTAQTNLGGAIGAGLSSGVSTGVSTGLAGAPISVPDPAVPPVTAGSGGSFTQGAPLPDITTSQQQQTIAPQFYTDYLSQLASQGQNAVDNSKFVGLQPLQTQAMSLANQNVGNYQTPLSSATDLANSAGGSNVAAAIGNLNANNLKDLTANANAGLVGTGGFGSSRGINALGSVISNQNLATQAQQAQAMNTDYQNKLAASGQLQNIAGQTQSLGLGDVNALATLGGQQQTNAQNQQLFPMQQLSSESQLLKGYTVPTSVSSTYTGPIPGAYQASPLQQIAGLGALAAGVSSTPFGQAIGTGVQKLFSGLSSIAPQGTNYVGLNSAGQSVYYNSVTGQYENGSGVVVPVQSDEG